MTIVKDLLMKNTKRGFLQIKVDTRTKNIVQKTNKTKQKKKIGPYMT